MQLKMVVPKGRMLDQVRQLLSDSGLRLSGNERNYRPNCSDPQLEIKLLKAQNIPQMVAMGQHDCGFAGLDWIRELDADVETVLDLGFNPVSIVACIPEDWNWDQVKRRPIIAVSEYRNLTSRFLDALDVEFTFLRAFGATEVFPPEDADLIVDNSSTGTTLRENRLKVIDSLMDSSTHFIANPAAVRDAGKREKIENLAVIFRSILDGRARVLLEMNCGDDQLDRVVDLLPAMKAPSIAKLYGQSGFAVKAAIPRAMVKDLVPKLRRAGATDILELDIRKVIA